MTYKSSVYEKFNFKYQKEEPCLISAGQPFHNMCICIILKWAVHTFIKIILWINQKPFHTRCSFRQWSRRPGFNPMSRHTKDFKNGTWYLLA